jgi:AcrR family transcriptional regulator
MRRRRAAVGTARRRKALLDEAEALLLARGRAGLTLRALGARLGVSAMTPYLHFRSKADLEEALRRRGLRELDRRLSAAAGAAPQPERLRALGEAYARFARERRALFALMFADSAEGARSRPQVPRPIADLVATATGDPSPQAAAMAWAAIHGWTALECARLVPTSMGAALPKLLDALVDGIAEIGTTNFDAAD